MNCLHCGDCCLRMSPLSSPEPCPFVIKIRDFYFCSHYYKDRPEECKFHAFSFAQHCPIGIEKLGLKDIDDIVKRIDDGREITKSL